MENPIKLDDLGGFPPMFGNTHMVGMDGYGLKGGTLKKVREVTSNDWCGGQIKAPRKIGKSAL